MSSAPSKQRLKRDIWWQMLPWISVGRWLDIQEDYDQKDELILFYRCDFRNALLRLSIESFDINRSVVCVLCEHTPIGVCAIGCWIFLNIPRRRRLQNVHVLPMAPKCTSIFLSRAHWHHFHLFMKLTLMLFRTNNCREGIHLRRKIIVLLIIQLQDVAVWRWWWATHVLVWILTRNSWCVLVRSSRMTMWVRERGREIVCTLSQGSR